MAIIAAGVIIAGGIFFGSGGASKKASAENSKYLAEAAVPVSAAEEAILPTTGVVLPVVWGDLGQKLTSVGAIDQKKFEALYKERGQWSDEYNNLLNGTSNGKIKITKDNAAYLLNLLWALGLANKNTILDSGEMTDKRYGGAQNFASTAGWTIAAGNPMDHYSRHKFFDLTDSQQALVDKVSRGIFRPCCGNSTHFPDCNHGMAMLGLLELMASQGVNEQEMWQAALAVNSYWFPDTYLTIAAYMKNKGTEWKDVNPEEVLGVDYSSAEGYQRIASQVTAPASSQGGSGCSVGASQTAPSVSLPRQQSGCSI